MTAAPPFNWYGSSVHLEDNLRRTVSRMLGEGLDEADLADLAAFVREGPIEPVNPYLATRATAAQTRGRALFFSARAGCGGCHVPPAFADGRRHALGTATGTDEFVAKLHALSRGEPAHEPAFDTPSLRGLHATAPYLHDGSAPTLLEVLRLTEGTMWSGELDAREREDLVAYLLTL